MLYRSSSITHIEVRQCIMKAILAVKSKKDEDVTATAVAMLRTFENTEALGIASSNAMKIGKSIEKLQRENLSSSVIVGCAFSKTLKDDAFPLKALKNSMVAFDGRIYSSQKVTSTKNTIKNLSNLKTARKFVKETDGDFAFISAETERLIAGRDVFGARPLYYGENEKFLALASERKALWTAGIKNTMPFPSGHIAYVEKDSFKITPAKILAYSKPKQIQMEEAVEKLSRLFENSVKKKVFGLKQVAVAFSGGLDSSLIAATAKNEGVNVHLIHVSLEKQPETMQAKKAAESLDLPIHIYQYKEEDVEKILSKVLWLIEEPDSLKTSIGIPICWTAEKTRELGFRVLLAGQGADELFGGYERYTRGYLSSDAEQVKKSMFNDVLNLSENNIERDFKICNFHDVELRLPFATYSIAKFAIDLPIELKIDMQRDGLRKLVLRQTAKKMGLPIFIVDKPKKAIQYATGIDKTLRKIAKKEKMSLKEYLIKTFQTMKNVKNYA